MSATYPDLFAASSCFSGVAAGCLAGSRSSSPQAADPTCANGKINKTPEQWGETVKNMYPGYNGPRPRMQLWHGTADPLVKYPNLAEQIKLWSLVLNAPFSKNVTGDPQAGYTKMVFGDGTKLVAYSAQGVGHTVPINGHQKDVLAWFGI
jgi:acetylxylan esterase